LGSDGVRQVRTSGHETPSSDTSCRSCHSRTAGAVRNGALSTEEMSTWLAELLARSGIGGPVVLVGASIAGFDVRVFASDHPDRAAGLVLVNASHEDQAHEVPRMARLVPLLSTIGVLRLFGISFGQSRIAGSVSAPVRAGNEFPRSWIPGGG
jgi:pimeloyl-ACP methyl ester carboxylesterase